MPRVLNKRTDGLPQGAVYVGRPSEWGNPFYLNNENQRDAVCDNYETWIDGRTDFIAAVKKHLKGKDLVCWCAPKRCHADTLLRIANEE